MASRGVAENAETDVLLGPLVYQVSRWFYVPLTISCSAFLLVIRVRDPLPDRLSDARGPT